MTCESKDCIKTRKAVRTQLAIFAMLNYIAGLGTFMFFLCSNSSVHRDQLGSFAADPVRYIHRSAEPGHNGHH